MNIKKKNKMNPAINNPVVPPFKIRIIQEASVYRFGEIVHPPQQIDADIHFGGGVIPRPFMVIEPEPSEQENYNLPLVEYHRRVRREVNEFNMCNICFESLGLVIGGCDKCQTLTCYRCFRLLEINVAPDKDPSKCYICKREKALHMEGINFLPSSHLHVKRCGSIACNQPLNIAHNSYFCTTVLSMTRVRLMILYYKVKVYNMNHNEFRNFLSNILIENGASDGMLDSMSQQLSKCIFSPLCTSEYRSCGYKCPSSLNFIRNMHVRDGDKYVKAISPNIRASKVFDYLLHGPLKLKSFCLYNMHFNLTDFLLKHRENNEIN